MSTPPNQPSEEELRAAYEAELKKIRVEDVLVQTLVSLINLGGRRAGLAQGAEDEAFIDANQRLALAVQAHGAEALVLSAGWDAHRDDPLSRLAVTTAAFPRIGEIWGKLALPTLIVQEGGYSLKACAEAAPEFVEGFRSAAGV